ncbi:MAG: replication protein A 70 kDa DNA-binding subunit [Monoraphidium minutum]|nr:MAG: replication protein A 70 kDa DNA-binding subunit [Monoraphidium minutum]
MAAQLTRGALEACKGGKADVPVTLRLTELKKSETNNRWTFKCTDGSGACMEGLLATQLARQVESGALRLQGGDVVRTANYQCNEVADGHKLMINELEVAAADSGAPRDQAGAPPPAGAAPCAGTPAAARPVAGTPGPTPSPSEEVRRATPVPLPLSPVRHAGVAAAAATAAAAASPAGAALAFLGGPPMPSPSPAAAARGGGGGGGAIAVRESRPNVQPIAALNPYDTQWTIKAKVVRKLPARSFPGRGGQQQRTFTVELADAQGGQVQATFWREAAERFYDSLTEGRVYYVSKFSVKVANKQYNLCRNDYEIHCDAKTEVEESADQSGIDVVSAADITPLDRLPGYINRKAPVDVLGVVLSLGSLGTVKRKADNSELPRRDVTLGDASGRSVVVTLWNDNARSALLEGAEGQALQITAVRVGDFNGCSASSGVRSALTLNPDTEEGRALRDWYAAEGGAAAFTPLGQGAVAGGEGGRRGRLNFLSDVVVEGADMPPPDSKPAYATLHATVVAINPDQTLYYLANPESGKKVVEQGGGFWSEAEGKMVPSAEHRYVLSCRVADATGETYVNLFNKEAEAVLGASADRMAELRAGGEEGEAAFTAALKAARWQTWVMNVQARSREYQGERRMRYTVMQAFPLDYAAESTRLLAAINGATQ